MSASKKPAPMAVAAAETSPNVRTEEFTPAQRELAEWLHIDVQASPNVRTDRAMYAYNSATRSMVEAGLLLLSVRAEVGAEGFAAALEERGMPKQRAYELMAGAALVARLPAEQREQVMALHRTKVALLASASPGVVEAALQDDEIDIDTLSVRKLRDRIRELEEQTTDLGAQRDAAEAKVTGLERKLKRGVPDREDDMPHAVADLRQEALELGKKADLCIASFGPLQAAVEEVGSTEAGRVWADGTARLAVSQLAALRLQLDGALKSWLDLLPGRDPTLVPAAYLTKQELVDVGRRFGELTALHDYEAKLRAKERADTRPQGPGRPKKAPAPPKGAKA